MDKKHWTLREARISDAKALSDCMQAAYGIYGSRLSGKTLPPMTVNYEDEIRTYPVWVAESDGIIVGGLILMPEASYMTLANVAVHPQFQGYGLGRGLMALADFEAKQQGYSELRLATHISLTETISLYAHLGWLEISRDDYRVTMQKRLACHDNSTVQDTHPSNAHNPHHD